MKEKRLAVIFDTDHSDTIGNACRVALISYLSSIYESTVYTNVPGLLTPLIGSCRLVPIPDISNRIPAISRLLRWKAIASIINSDDTDGVFMFHDTAPSAHWIKYPCFQYVHQYGARSNKRCDMLRRLVMYATERIVIAGLRKSELNFVVSQQIIDLLTDERVTNTVLVPHGVHLKDFRQPYLTDFHASLRDKKNTGGFVVTYAGSVTENRGLLLMLESMRNAICSDQKIFFVVAGADDVHHERIREFGLRNGIIDNIISFGKIDVSLVPGILYHSDVCFSFLDDTPAHRLSPPQKVVEYFAAGRPVIANAIITHRLVQDGVNGYIVENDPRQIGATIRMLKNNGGLLQELSANALDTARQFDLEHVYGEMVRQINRRMR